MLRITSALILILFLITLSLANKTQKANADNGRNQFRQTCKNCHTKGAVGGEVTPLTRTSAQWHSFFEKGKHNGSSLTEIMPAKQLRDVEEYLIKHAADSEQPEICGR